MLKLYLCQVSDTGSPEPLVLACSRPEYVLNVYCWSQSRRDICYRFYFEISESLSQKLMPT
jgi:hypothetical protein